MARARPSRPGAPPKPVVKEKAQVEPEVTEEAPPVNPEAQEEAEVKEEVVAQGRALLPGEYVLASGNIRRDN